LSLKKYEEPPCPQFRTTQTIPPLNAIPILADISMQRAIVVGIEAEQELVAANRELIERFEKKIQGTLGRVWGEGSPNEAKS
ncbi:MAG: hypothetical protein ABSF43_14630, partial [Rectinemataceae bacterium]